MPGTDVELRCWSAVVLGSLLALLFVASTVEADDTVPYRHYTLRDGLPHESVVALEQGPDGRLWIGTEAGLAVFDGHSIQPVPLPDSLGTPHVVDVHARSSGRICAALQAQAIVCLRRGRVDWVAPLPNDTNDPIRLLSRNDTLLAVMRKGLWRRPPGTRTVTKRSYDYPIQTGALANLDSSVGLGVTDATLAPDGTLWVVDERHGLGRVSRDGAVTFLDLPQAQTSRDRWVSARMEGPQTALVSQSTGTYRVDLSSGRNTAFSSTGHSELHAGTDHLYGVDQNRVVRWQSTGTVSFTPELGLPHTLYQTVLEDAQGGLWIGTGDGLLHLPAPQARHRTQIDGVALRWMLDFGVDSTRQELWAASWGKGLFRLHPDPERRVLGPNGKWASLAVKGQDGALHTLTRGGWFRRGADGWSSVNTSLSATRGVVRPSGTGYFWTDDGLVRLRPQATATPDTLWRWPREKRGYYKFALAPDGNVLAYTPGALLRLPPSRPHQADTLLAMPEYRGTGIESMVIQNQALWMTFQKHGLVRVGLNERAPGVEQVLPEAGNGHLTPVGGSLLFVGTKDGLYVVDSRSGRLHRRLTVTDGLVSNGTFAAQLYEDTLYVSHSEGLSKLPRSVLDETPTAPTTLLTRWSVNDSTRRLTDSTRLAANERTVSFNFAGVQLARGRSVQYEYRLPPHDTTWTRTQQSFTRYTGLSPGTYRFEVRAQLANGPTGPPAHLTFTVPKAYHETAWFRGLSVVVVLLLLGGAYAWRTRALRRRKEKLQRMVDERTAQLAEEKEKTEEQARRLETLDAEKNRFFANISHELRTPLTILQGTLQDVLDGTVGDVSVAVREKLEILQGNVGRLHRLTEQLLDLSRLETTGPSIEPEPRDLVADLRRMTRSFVPLAERRGLQLSFESAVGSHPCRVDPEKLEKIVGNLLSNALQHTPEGGQVTVQLDVTDGSPPTARLRVSDTGRGIAPERQDAIFERFHTVHDETEGRTGTGVGLALAREYAELHGGTIEVDSTPGEGSTFTVRLPVPPADPSAVETDDVGTAEEAPPVGSSDRPAAPTGDGALQGEADQPVVLVVEDNADVRAYLRRHLTDDYHVLTAPDGEDALAKAREVDPDLILTDLMMPTLNGIELCRRIRDDEDLRHLPIVLLTARATEEDAVTGLDAGADAYVTKPFSMAELKARIRRLLEAHWAGAPTDAPERHLAPDVDPTPEAEAFLDRVTDAIDNHRSRTSFTVDDLAAEVGLSPRQLHRKLKRWTDLTPAVFIRHYRLDVAAQLLRDDAGTVSEVAYEVGFGTPETFAKHFEERFGRSPSAYAESQTA